MQQSSISSFFTKKKASSSSNSNLNHKPSAQVPSQVICLESDEEDGADEEGGGIAKAITDYDPSEARSSRFRAALSSAFDGVVKDPSGGASGSSSSSGKTPKAADKKTKQRDAYTPLEKQVLELRKEHPDALLMVECGYRLRFFDKDAINAAKVLSIHAHKDHNFMVASVPTHRFLVHARRLIAAGYRVGLVRQTETAAIHGKTKSSGKTFDRSCVGIYTPGKFMDDDDPAFVDMTSLRKKREPSEDDEMDEDEGEDGDIVTEIAGVEGTDEPLLTVILNDASSTATAIVSIQLRAGVLHHRLVRGDPPTREQETTDYLDMLRPTEVVSDTTISSSLWSALVQRCRGVISVERCAEREGQDRPEAAALPGAFVVRLCKVSAPPTVATASATASVHSPLESLAFSALERYLESLMLRVNLEDLQLCNDNPRKNEVEDKKELEMGAHGGASVDSCFRLDPVTARDLEVFCADTNTSFAPVGGSSMPCLLQEMNHCRSAFGKRTLRNWLAAPLTSVTGIQQRQRAVAWLLGVLNEGAGQSKGSGRRVRNSALGVGRSGDGTVAISENARWLGDAERALSGGSSSVERWLNSLKSGKLSPSNLSSLLQWASRLTDLAPPQSLSSSTDEAGGNESSSETFPHILQRSLQPRALQQVAQEASRLLDLLSSGASVDWKTATDGSVMASLGDDILCRFDYLRQKRTEVASYEDRMQEHLRSIRKTLRQPGLQYRTLNTGGGSCIEHLIEVEAKAVAANSSLVPADWVPMNSTKTTLRFHPPDVLQTQQKLILARDETASAARAAWKEFLLLQVSPSLCKQLLDVVAGLGVVDALLSLARLASRPGYTCPHYTNSNSIDGIEDETIALKQARHPVAERLLELGGEGQFQPNDVTLRCNFRERSCLVVTGPNMGGKSTYVRMVSVLCLMGQIGSYIPAESASLPVLDNIFTRMGAGDDLAAGRSTFATELFRTSAIFRRATARSLVVLDELGRGTSTNDGVCIAMAALQHFVDKVGCAMFFVTHYSQIADMVEEPQAEGAGREGKAQNIHMGYIQSEGQEQDEPQVLFLFQAVEGASKGSYGLNVARLAGLSGDLLKRAEQKSEWLRSKISSGTTPAPVPAPAPAFESASPIEIDPQPGQAKRKRSPERGLSQEAPTEEQRSGNTGKINVKSAVEEERRKLQRLIEDSQRKLEQLSDNGAGAGGEALGPDNASQGGGATQWRDLVMSGNIQGATEALGHYPYLTGTVIHGEKRGRTIGYPTANLGIDFQLAENVIPSDGVYAGWLTVDNQELRAAISIGTNPTFEGERNRQVEAFALRQDSWIDLYDMAATVTFKERLRDTVKYEGADWLDQLLQQMAKDCDRAWELTGRRKSE